MTARRIALGVVAIAGLAWWLRSLIYAIVMGWWTGKGSRVVMS